jgi:hypoxanthine phosphoribosyltransferase
MTDLHQDVARVMITEHEIQAKAKEMAETLDKLYAGKTPVVICILKGSIMFLTDLIRNMKTDVEIDFMSVSSYGRGTASSGEVKILKDLTTDIRGRDVLIVEDIIDSGNTLFKLKNMLYAREPASINIVTMLDKPQRREVDMNPEYTCFVIEDEFVIGYGLDYAEKYRELPEVCVLKRSVYEK